MLEIILSGGWLMVPILACSAIAMAIILERFWSLRTNSVIPPELGEQVQAWALSRKLEESHVAALAENSQLGRILAAALRNRSRSRDIIKESVEDTGRHVIHDLERYLNTLGTIAGISPLLGLLGTVTGMISLFEVITNYGTGDPRIMAAGISEALITTQTGLVVAIPILLVHNMLRNRKKRLQDETERSAVVILNRIWPGTEDTTRPESKSEPKPKDDLAAEGEPELAGGP